MVKPEVVQRTFARRPEAQYVNAVCTLNPIAIRFVTNYSPFATSPSELSRKAPLMECEPSEGTRSSNRDPKRRRLRDRSFCLVRGADGRHSIAIELSWCT